MSLRRRTINARVAFKRISKLMLLCFGRAFYRDADILLLDDPLSAVDSRVGRLLFYSAIQDLGFKRGKCVVLVTHQHQFIANSRCLYMAGGKIACVGSYQKCVDASDGKLTLAVQTSSDDLTKLNTPQDTTSSARKDAVKKDDKEAKSGGEMAATKGGEDQDDDYKEQSNTGVVQRQTFLDYARAMPGGLVAGLLMVSVGFHLPSRILPLFSLSCLTISHRWFCLQSLRALSWYVSRQPGVGQKFLRRNKRQQASLDSFLVWPRPL